MPPIKNRRSAGWRPVGMDAGLQVIVSSCHTPETVPLAWRVVRL